MKQYKVIKEWTTEAGYEAKAILMQMGSINGYVLLPKGHKLYGLEYDDIDIRVHGGLTYSRQENDDWVIGFDTAHSGDKLDIELAIKELGEEGDDKSLYDMLRATSLSRYGTKRPLEYVIEQCESVAKQASEFK